MKKQNLCFVDFGASHISLAICEIKEDTLQKVVFFSKKNITTQRTRKELFEITEIYGELLKLIDEAEKQTKIAIFEIILLASTENIKTTSLEKTFLFEKKQKLSKFTIEDMLVKTTRGFSQSRPLETILDVINTNYILDEATNTIKNPYKLSCNIVKVKTNIISINNVFERKLSSYLARYKIHIKHYINPCGAVAVFLKGNINPDEPTLIVDLGGYSTEYCLIYDENIIASGFIDTGGQDITQNIAKTLNIFPTNAEKLKQLSINANADAMENDKILLINQKIKKIMNADIAKIATEIKNIIRSNPKINNFTISRIILTGGVSKYEQTEEIFKNAFNCQVETISDAVFTIEEKSGFFEKLNKEMLATENIHLISAIEFYLSNIENYEKAKCGFLFKIPSKISCLLRDLLY